MKKLILLLCVGIIGHAQAEISEQLYLTYMQKSSAFDSTLYQNHAKYSFELENVDGSANVLYYSVDGIDYSQKLPASSIDVITSPGKHIFAFYYSENYYEVYTDSIEISSQMHDVYSIYFQRADIQIMVDKPVIYLYPEQETEVEVKLKIAGKGTFFYPAYVDSWKFKASPSGELKFGDATYNYLFWEAEQSRMFGLEEIKTGFVVRKAEVISFLEDKLTQAGLNSKERADFITYWGPRLAQNELNFVRFEFNEECNRYAELNIAPAPQTIYRIYIAWMPIEAAIEVSPQEIPEFIRNGFSVLEWGGCEVKSVTKISRHAVK